MNDTFIWILGVESVILIAVLLALFIVRYRIEMRYSGDLSRLNAELDHEKEKSASLADDLAREKESVRAAVDEAVKAAEDAAALRLSAKEQEIDLLKKHHLDALADKDRLLQARDNAYREEVKTLRDNFADAISTLKAQVRADTDELLKARQNEFRETSGEAIKNILSPLKEQMDTLRDAVDKAKATNAETKESFSTGMKTLMDCTSRVSTSADQLAAAFKYGNKIQGDWGETILEELLSSQGLTRGVHFDVQSAKTAEDGSRPRPDVIIHLDRRREVIVDAKTSLSAYMSYVNAQNEEDRDRYLKMHIASIKGHVKELVKKDYSSYITPPKVSAGYVIMFVPNMGALWTALNAEPDLWRKAAEQNVYIADEQSLYGAIRIVQLTWTQVLQAENHEKVFALADEMVDRVEKFLSSYEGIGKALDAAVKAYDEGHKKLEPRGKSIVLTAAKLTKLGAKKGKVLDGALVDIDEIPELGEPVKTEE